MTGINGYNPYNPYNQSSMQMYRENLKNVMEQAKGQLQQLEQMPIQPPMAQAPITQNFQLAPQTNNPNELQSAYANGIDEVKNIFMTRNGIFVDKGLTTVWFKNTEGKIRTFTLTEVVEKDEKDIQIESLMRENNEKNFEINSLKKQVEEIKYLMMQQNTKNENSQAENLQPEKKVNKK